MYYVRDIGVTLSTELPKKIISETQSKPDGHFVDIAARRCH